VTSEVVVAARCAHEPSRRVSLQPSLALSPVPDAVLGTEHPASPFAVEDCEVADCEPKRSGLQAAVATLVDEQPIARLGVCKRIDSHGESIARSALARPGRGGGTRIDGV
jgi:hypothetical protein